MATTARSTFIQTALVHPARARRTSSPTIAIRISMTTAATTVVGRLIAILDAPRAPAAAPCREAELGAVLTTLSAIESRAMHARLQACNASDELAHKFARLEVEGRARLLSVLAGGYRDTRSG